MSRHPKQIRDTLQPLLHLLDGVEVPTLPLLADRLGQVLEAAAGVLAVDRVGLMLLDQDGILRVAGVSDDMAALLEDAQAELHQGPGIDSVRGDTNVAVTDLADEQIYARLWRRIGSDRLRAVLSSPVRAGGEVVGNLNAIMGVPHVWSDEQVAANQAYAHVVGLTLGLAAQSLDAGKSLLQLGRLLAAGKDGSDDDEGPS